MTLRRVGWATCDAVEKVMQKVMEKVLINNYCLLRSIQLNRQLRLEQTLVKVESNVLVYWLHVELSHKSTTTIFAGHINDVVHMNVLKWKVFWPNSIINTEAKGGGRD